MGSEEEAIQFLNNSLVHTFYIKVNRGQSVTPQGPQGSKQASMKVLEIDRQQKFEADQYYVWFLEGSKLKSMLGGIAMVAIILAGVMFPLWPTSLRIGVWYLSMAMLGVIALFFGLAIFRLIFYVITIVVAKPGIWIFPNLFADVGFVGGLTCSGMRAWVNTDIVASTRRSTALSPGGSGTCRHQRRRRWAEHLPSPRRCRSLTQVSLSAAQGRRGQSRRLEQKGQEKQREWWKQDRISPARCYGRGCRHDYEHRRRHEQGQGVSNIHGDRGCVGWSRQEQRWAAGQWGSRIVGQDYRAVRLELGWSSDCLWRGMAPGLGSCVLTT